MFINRVFVHPTSGMSGATASSPVCAVLGMLLLTAFIALVVIAIGRDADRLLSAAIIVAIVAILLAIAWGVACMLA